MTDGKEDKSSDWGSTESEPARLRLENELLRIAARHQNLLQKEAFDEIADVVCRVAGVATMGIVVAEEPGYTRVYATSRDRPDFAVMGARVPQSRENYERVHVARGVHIFDEKAPATDTERLVMEAGLKSWVELPIVVPGHPVFSAGIVYAFREQGAARKADIGLLQVITDVISTCLGRSLDAARDHRLGKILDTSGDAMLAWDLDGTVTDANLAAERLTGIAREQLLGKPIYDLMPAARTIPSNGTAQRLTLVTPREPRTVEATITTIDEDPIVSAHALVRDISAMVRAEEAAALHLVHIRRLEELHREVLDNTPLIIFRLDPKTLDLTYLSRHAERLLGVPTQEALQTKDFLQCVHADAGSVAALEAAVRHALHERGGSSYEARLRRPHGDEILVRGHVYPMFDAQGVITSVEGVLADVSSEQAARSRLVQADRLSTLGMLAAGVAHEINNPAAFVLLGIDMLDRVCQSVSTQLPPEPRAQATLLIAELRDSIHRIVDIARDLRLFASAPTVPTRTFIDVNRSIESALTLTRGHLMEHARIVRDLHEVPPVTLGENRLGQVLVNLLVNAAHAIPKSDLTPPPGGHAITVTTRQQDANVVIEVSDTGTGIAPENLHRIWTAFFTTKSPDAGTGLGLSISKDIIERAGGTIRAESPVPGTNRGTRFTITLPITDQRPQSKPAGHTVQPSNGTRPRARVLLVEDEPSLARALAEGLGYAHDVKHVSRAQDALELLVPSLARGAASPEVHLHGPGESTPHSEHAFDVVLCDLRMPTMSGEALYSEVKAHDSELARSFIFMTGVGFGADVEQFLRDSGQPVLEKPFGTEDALEQIAKVLHSRKTEN